MKRKQRKKKKQEKNVFYLDLGPRFQTFLRAMTEYNGSDRSDGERSTA